MGLNIPQFAVLDELCMLKSTVLLMAYIFHALLLAVYVLWLLCLFLHCTSFPILTISFGICIGHKMEATYSVHLLLPAFGIKRTAVCVCVGVLSGLTTNQTVRLPHSGLDWYWHCYQQNQPSSIHHMFTIKCTMFSHLSASSLEQGTCPASTQV